MNKTEYELLNNVLTKRGLTDDEIKLVMSSLVPEVLMDLELHLEKKIDTVDAGYAALGYTEDISIQDKFKTIINEILKREGVV